ncbi:MAG: helix-turn-helix domain-containing protein [Sporolactobacillus sp.]
MSDFKCRLKVILAERDMKQGELIKKVGVSRATMSQLVNGKTLPNFETAYAISEALGLKIEDIWIKKDRNS